MFRIIKFFIFFPFLLLVSSLSPFIIKNSSNSDLPLKSIKNLIEITEGIARVKIIQEYLNDREVSLEVDYRFPINPDSVFDSFEATIGNRTIRGQIKEKKQAQQEYFENLQKGNTVAYSQIEDSAKDIMKVSLGNLLPNQQILIQYSYIESLELVLNKFRRFTLYSTLTPRYNPLNSGISDIPIKEKVPTENTYKWEIMVNISSQSELENVYSPSHNISMMNLERNGRNLMVIGLDPLETHEPNKDFVLVYQEKEAFTPKVVVERHPIYQNSRVAALSFFPQMNSLSISEAKEFLSKGLENSPLLSDIQRAKGEFFFVIDRSASMLGARIQNLKRALSLFLKSLPQNSFFNVISFGSSFEPLFKPWIPYSSFSSVKFSPETLQSALDSISSFEADFGGTEIHDPIKAVLDLPPKEGYPRLVFLLTDGDVMNNDQCIKMTKKSIGFSRIYTVGIGNGVSVNFIKSLAEVGKGKSEFVKDEDRLEEKTMHLLHSSISPYARKVKIEISGGNVAEIVPKMEDDVMILKNEMMQMFIFLKEGEEMENRKEFQVRVSYENSFTGKTEQFQTYFNQIQTPENINDVFHKLAIKKKIKSLNEQLSENPKNSELLQKDIVSNSVKYQVLCEETAFITVLSENSDSLSLEREKLTVDNIISSDYLLNNALLISSSLPSHDHSDGIFFSLPDRGAFGPKGDTGPRGPSGDIWPRSKQNKVIDFSDKSQKETSQNFGSKIGILFSISMMFLLFLMN